MIASANKTIRNIAVMGVVILLLRVAIVELYEFTLTNYNISFSDEIATIFQDHLMLATYFVTSTLYATLFYRWTLRDSSPVRHLIVNVAYVVVASLIIAFLRCRTISNHMVVDGDTSQEYGVFIASLLVVAMINTLTIAVIDMIIYKNRSKHALVEEQGARTTAEYRYLQLKQQLNPHFLFNSLNILDYLVQGGERERASLFLRKLAGVYRYLLTSEQSKVVDLQSEIVFIGKYVDLLSERFGEALSVVIEIDERYMSRKIVPCGLLVLFENAVKHNIANKSQPLRVVVSIVDDSIEVSNNLQPRIGDSDEYESTKVGLTNLRGQYRLITQRPIEVVEGTDIFSVKLPLL